MIGNAGGFMGRNGGRALGVLFLAVMGWLLNLVTVPLFFGVDFVFGSIATLLAIALLGPRIGVLISLVPAIHTYFLWNHPYAGIVLVGEAIFVSALWKKTYANLVIATAIYWIVLGMGQVWLYYHGILGMDETSALFAAVKQSCNGILNSLIVHLLMTYGPLARWSLAPWRQRTSVFQPIFGFLAVSAVLPSLLFFTINSREVVARIDESLRLRLDTISTALALSSERWREQNMSFMRTAAAMAEQAGMRNTARLQEILTKLNPTAKDMFSIYIGNEKGVTVAFDPPRNAYGASNLGIDLSDRIYFRRLKEGLETSSISPILMGRGGFREPLIILSHSIFENERFAGFTAGAVDLRRFRDLLTDVKASGNYNATVLDELGNVIVSSDPGIYPMDDFRQERLKEVRIEDSGFFYRRPEGEAGAPMANWKNSWMGKATQISGPGDWRLVVELPMGPAQTLLYAQYLKSLGSLLVLMLLVIAISAWIASWVSRPLMEFAQQTTDLPERLWEADRIRWPQSPFMEFRTLVSNMRAMTIELRRKFRDLEASTEELQKTTRTLEALSAESRDRAHRQAFLAHAGKEMGSSLDIEKILNALANLVVPEWADWCVVNIVNSDGSLSRLGLAHRDPGKETLLAEIFQNLGSHESSYGVMGVLKEGKPKFYNRIDGDLLARISRTPKNEERLKLVGLASYLCVPLRVRDAVVGTISMGRGEDSEGYREEDLGFAVEISERTAIAIDNARLYKEAQNLNRIKDEFLATLSHELRTPLSIILGHSEILKHEAPSLGPDLDLSVDAIHRNAKVQNQIISDLLDVSAIIAGKITFHPVPIEMSEIIRSAAESIRFAAESKGVRLDLLVSDESLPVMADPTRLQQVIWNLLSNAVKFTPKGGRVEVSARIEESKVVLRVKDSGQGIEPDFLPYIFDRFRQEDNSMTRRHGGLGLGLSIVRQLVELHGGSILVESAGKGHGSTFTVFLPVQAILSKGRNVAEGLPGSDSARELQGLKILVVDDEPDARQMIIELLERAGAEVCASASASEGLAEYERSRPDLIVSDIGMPGEDGFSFLRRLRDLESRLDRFTPALALTAYAREEDRRKALGAGYQNHLAKPVGKKDFLSALAALVRQYR